MTIRTMLVPLYGNGLDAQSLDMASDIARRLQTHIVALISEPDAPALLPQFTGEGGSGGFPQSLVTTLQERLEARRAAAERHFSEWLSRSQISFASSAGGSQGASAELVIVPGREAQTAIADYCVVADLVVAPLGKGPEPDRATTFRSALFDTGRPVLAIPEGWSASIFAAPVAIAWNYSAEAARAVNAALPIIKAVGEAIVLLAGRHDNEEAGRRMANYLTWHGVKVRIVRLGQAGKPTELIDAAARSHGAKLLVMGAYSHIRRGTQFVFGGMTGYMLEKAPVPLLLVH